MKLTVNVTAYNGAALADMINFDFKNGDTATVNGETLVSRHGQPVARAWQNGTVSVTVKARTTRGTKDLFVKVGSALVLA